MAYVEGRIVHDADSHIMETAEMLADFASARVKNHLLGFDGATSVATSVKDIAKTLAHHRDPAYRAKDADEIMARKNWAATGAYYKDDRPAALDLLGFTSQLVFNTFVNGYSAHLERKSDDLDLIYGTADAHNRAMLDFCSVDRRLLATAYIPLADFERTRAIAERAIADGFPALLIPSHVPAAPLAEPHGSVSVVGARRRSRRADPVPRRRRRCTARSRTTSSTVCRYRPISTAARRTSVRSTTWRSRRR